jgi:hypothetical protein
MIEFVPQVKVDFVSQLISALFNAHSLIVFCFNITAFISIRTLLHHETMCLYTVIDRRV